ncbi:helix-turn-helix domain-containing protein [Sulfitobacter albidus]|uniref:Helix-turn-helix domain-containing protein n=1 Tax=Sulfitobacter albidus TaxID=2829501 RepID=A0A975PNJ5_9RHOB|nr:helix-turn-helix transcriptional regulator [Sulfitobacter albidus]QUJ77375.1 helix-turn-helix domain-containing protein [Sulfitobacter albidus]
MSAEAQTGSRIRERRVMQSLKQAELAQRIGISPSYLNLIEHNKRRIGGKLLLDIARALEVEPHALTDGAEAALLGALHEAALAVGIAPEEMDRVEVFAGRFPGWAEALAAQGRRIADLERTVETLSDRMAHDPHLAGQMHELLTTAAAVRSTAEILAGEEALEREWQKRFHTNLDTDSARLAESVQSLVGYLEDDRVKAAPEAGTPQAEVEAYLAQRAYHLPALEDGAGDIDALLEAADPPLSVTAAFILRGVLTQMASDAAALPMARLQEALTQTRPDPVALARRLGAPVGVVLRRLASVETLGVGLVVCDRSGTVIFRKSVDGFSVPQFDSCCPLWPLFGALAAPGTVLHERIGQLGRGQAAFDAYATAEPQVAPAYNAPPLARGILLLVPAVVGDTTMPLRTVGATCRICPDATCGARRVPSILAAEGL